MSKLRHLDVTNHTEKKGQFSYLSWAWAVDQLIAAYPDATWEIKRFPLLVKDGESTKAIPEMQLPYMKTAEGYFVEVAVTVEGVTRGQIHPVLDNRNQPIKSPTSFQINTSIQRALAKAIALHGLGLYIYAGEDLPPDVEGVINGGKIDMERVHAAVAYIKSQIDEDDPDNAPINIRKAWGRLSNDERMEIQNHLGDKAPDTNRMYKTLLKDYLNHEDAA